MKCLKCKIYKEAQESDVPAVCAWYLENVVCGFKILEDCPEFEEVNK